MAKIKASKTLFGPIKPTDPSVRMACKGQSSFGKCGVYMCVGTSIVGALLLHNSSLSYTREGETLWPFPLTSLPENFLVLHTFIYHKL